MNSIGILAFVVLIASDSPQDPNPDPLGLLVRQAVEQNPGLAAARQRVRAAEARLAPAGALPDPVLSLTLRNFPVAEPGFEDFMTMKAIGLSQRFPYPGKLSLAQDVENRGLDAAKAALADLRLELEREVRHAYYELTFLDQAMEVVGRHADVLSALVLTADARYGLGTAGQEDVLHAQVESAILADEASRLSERRRGVLAGLNQLLDRPPATPVGPAGILEEVLAAVVRPPSQVGFASLDLGSRVLDSPLRPLDELLEVVATRNPMIVLHRARIEAQTARLELARKAHLPDIDVSLSYGQRNGRTDMVGLSIAMPLPLNRGARQDSWTAEAEAELAALEAEHRDHVNALRAKVSDVHADLERDRTGLALLTAAVLPQGRAALQAATSGFQVARTDFTTVLASQTALFQYETSFYRKLADFAQDVAELERLVGAEVLR